MSVYFTITTILNSLTIFKDFNLLGVKKQRLVVGILAAIILHLLFTKNVLAASCVVNPNTIIAGESTEVTVSGLTTRKYYINLKYPPTSRRKNYAQIACNSSPDAAGTITVNAITDRNIPGQYTIQVYLSGTTWGICGPTGDLLTDCSFTAEPAPTPINVGSCFCDYNGEPLDIPGSPKCNPAIAHPVCTEEPGGDPLGGPSFYCSCEIGPSPIPKGPPRTTSCLITCGQQNKDSLNYCFESSAIKQCCYSAGATTPINGNSPECKDNYVCDPDRDSYPQKKAAYSCADPDNYDVQIDARDNCTCLKKGTPAEIGEIAMSDAVRLCKPLCGQFPPREQTRIDCECYDPVETTLPCRPGENRNKTFVISHPKAEFSKCVQCITSASAYTALGCIPTKPIGFVSRVFAVTIPIMAGILFLGFIYVGFLAITSTGDPEKLAQTKDVAKSLIFGALIIIFSVFIYGLIGGTILKIPEFGP